MSESMKPPFGASVAVALGVVACALALRFIPQYAWDYGVTVNIPGFILTAIPVGAVLGWRFARRVGRWHPVPLIGWMAISAVLLGDAEVSAIYALTVVAISPLAAIASAPVVFAVGLIIFGVYVLPLTLMASIVWFLAFRGLEHYMGRGGGSPKARDPGSEAGVSVAGGGVPG